MYTLDTVVVEADRTKNKFGDTITEQSYYRTGGDVKVITREEIEKRHYTDLTEAIKRIPGVTFQNPGYRGTEYGYSAFNNSISINGDARVIVLVNGRRVDNASGNRFSSDYTDDVGLKTMVDLNQVINMEAVDKIEVIKGPGASVYGADATGGVINIITRKGGINNSGTIDLATGSWGKHVYNLSYSGSVGEDHSLNYFISATRQMAGDSKYHDGVTDKNYTFKGTSYKEEGINFRIEKDFGNERSLSVMYNHQNGLDHYPITAPYYPAWTPEGWEETKKYYNISDEVRRNGFLLDGLIGAYNAYRTNDLDVTYTFNKDNGMESFVRVYDQSHHYWTMDEFPWPWSTVPFPGGADFDKWLNEWKANAILTPKHLEHEKNRGIQVQYGKSFGIHDILASVTFDKAKTYKYRRDSSSTKEHSIYYKSSSAERNSVFGFVQDKIHITDKWDFTPAIRYSKYDSFNVWTRNKGDRTLDNSSFTVITPAVNTEYAFNDTMSAYLGWTKIYRPISVADYDTITPNGKALEDEKGNIWTVGLRKDFSENTTLAIHYDWTNMDNAITQYSVRVNNDWDTHAVNAKETKKSFNITLDTRLDDHWNLGVAYTYLNDKWSAKDGMEFDKDLVMAGGDVNAAINVLRPANHYTANLSYENGKWYSGLLINWYTGNDTKNFTARRFLVLDWNLNYDLSKELTLYTTITNLTNEAYENSTAGYGIGAAPQPGRAFMVGARYKF